LIAEPQAQGLLEHAAGCDACGEELRVATVCFDDDTEAETQPIVGLQASTPSWKKNMAAELAMRSSRVRRFPSRYMAIAAGIVLAMVGGTSTWWMMRTSSTDATASLLAQAYDSRPPFEYRIPGAQPGKPSPQRGSEESVKDRPLALLEAEARIQKEMSRPSPGIQWVSFMARADLLEGNYDEAIVSLLSLHEAKPNDTGVLAELGRAYAIRATQRTDHRQDIDSAVEYLNRALQIRPRDPETLFNLALLYTEIQQYSNAEETWRRYLAVDSTSAWAEEARSHLLEVQKKK
jgi:tetratricopeptide (TPR) repeat protein